MVPRIAKNEPVVRLSAVMEQLVIICKRDDLTLGEFLRELNLFGHMLVCLVFAVPFLLPVPLPGLSTIFGFVICVAATQLALGLDPWVPTSWREHKISTNIVVKIFEMMGRILKLTEKLIKPRLGFFARHPGFVRFNGVVIFLVALLLSLPMPPGFNAPPALAIVTLAIGSLERDGVAVIAGYVLSVLNALIFGASFVLGFEGLRAIFGV